MKKYVVMSLILMQSAFAGIGTSGGISSPIQFSAGRIEAVLQAVKQDPGFMFWQIKKIETSDSDVIKVEFLNEKKECVALDYQISTNSQDETQATIMKDAMVQCE